MAQPAEQVPFITDDWESFLEDYSAEIIASADPFYLVQSEDGAIELFEPFTDEQREQEWIGRPPAGMEALAEADARLGAALPPMLRGFFQVTDGWEWPPGDSIREVFAAANVLWFRDLENAQEVRDAFPEVVELLDRALLVGSGVGVAWLLDPTDVDADGEWAAYRWEPQYDRDPERFGSFAQLFAAERATFDYVVADEYFDDDEYLDDEYLDDEYLDDEYFDDDDDDDDADDDADVAVHLVTELELPAAEGTTSAEPTKDAAAGLPGKAGGGVVEQTG